ncbi:MAG: hypothetical protein ABIH52_03095 [Candidatus Aenigmatarchaeota archaeon]|nr:hypothetical protein [Nanoarchaeota archaeon]
MDFKDTQLFRMYIILFFKDIAGSMFYIFTPVFLFINGFSFLHIGLFFIFMSLTSVGSVFFLGGGFLKIKTKLSMNIGLMFLILSMILLYFTPVHPQLLLAAAVLMGLKIAFFWIPAHTTFAYESKGRVMGKEASIYVIMQKTGNIIGPLLASFVILFWGIEYIYFVGIFFVLICMVIITTLKASFTMHKVDFKKAFSRFDMGVSLALAGDGINHRMLSFALPLFIFIIIGSAAPIGWVVAGAVLLSFISIILIGIFSDYKKKFENRIFKIGVGASSLTWIFRIFAFNFWTLLILEYFDNLASSARNVPFVAYYYNKARNSHHVLEYTMVREIIIHTAIALSLIPITLTMMFFPIQYVFVIGAVVVWMDIFMVKKPQKLFFHNYMHPHK